MSIFLSQKKISLSHSDATGVLFFPMQLFLVHHVFEEFLDKKGLPLAKLFSEKKFLMPVRHVASDYLAPLYVGDVLDCSIEKIEQGSSSFSLQHLLHREKALVGQVTVVHVTIDPKTGQKIPLPQDLKDIFT